MSDLNDSTGKNPDDFDLEMDFDIEPGEGLTEADSTSEETDASPALSEPLEDDMDDLEESDQNLSDVTDFEEEEEAPADSGDMELEPLLADDVVEETLEEVSSAIEDSDFGDLGTAETDDLSPITEGNSDVTLDFVADGGEGESTDLEALESMDEEPVPEILDEGLLVVAEGTVAEEALPGDNQEAGAEPVVADAVEGQWVWQYAAPAPLPPFSARFFSGMALAELYRFFACGLLVAVGALLPWRTGDVHVAGYELTVGALTLAVAVWLCLSACYSIYTGRQKIIPVFLMLIPFEASLVRFFESWGAVSDMGFKERLSGVFEHAGTGVMFTVFGSTIVVGQLLSVLVKVFQKTPEEKEKAARRTKSRDKDSSKKKDKREKKGKKDRGEVSLEAGDKKDGKGRKGRRRRRR